MLRRLPFLTFLYFIAAYSASADDVLTKKNWVNHPAITEIRSLYQLTKALKAHGELVEKKREFGYCIPYADTDRILYTDKSGKPRIYYFSGGSDDSTVSTELYYDDAGTRRFAFIIARAINDTHLEHRVYFSKEGIKIWEAQKLLGGPGYTFPTEWPDEALPRDPMQAFSAKHTCDETEQ